MNHIGYVTEIPGLSAVAINLRPTAFQHSCNERGYYRGIRAARVLASAKHVEITQANRRQTVHLSVDACVKLTGIFSHGIRTFGRRLHTLVLR